MKGRRGMRLLAGASDERLVALAHAGDEQAFAAIVERYRPPLLRYCGGSSPAPRPRTRCSRRSSTPTRRCRATTTRGCRRRCGRGFTGSRTTRRSTSRAIRRPGWTSSRRGSTASSGRTRWSPRRERFRRVIGAVSALPPKQRQVIVRHAVDGDSHERIATDLGMSAGSIRQLAHRARRTVREAAAALLPGPLLRVLPFGADAAEVLPAAGGGAVLAKVAVVVVAAGAAGGGAVVAKHDTAKPATAKSHARPRTLANAGGDPAGQGRRAFARGRRVLLGDSVRTRGGDGSGSSKHGSSGSGKSGSSDSSGSGSSGSGSRLRARARQGPGPPARGSDSSGSGSSGSVTSGSGSSGSGSRSARRARHVGLRHLRLRSSGSRARPAPAPPGPAPAPGSGVRLGLLRVLRQGSSDSDD